MSLTTHPSQSHPVRRCVETTSLGEQASCVEVRGDLDRLDYDRFLRALLRVVEARQDVVVDLTETTYIDSAGMRAIGLARVAAEAAGRHLAVISPAGSIAARVIEIVGPRELVYVTDGGGPDVRGAGAPARALLGQAA